MTLAEIKDWLKTFNLFDYYYVGRIDGTKEKALGVYAAASTGTPVYAMNRASSYVINGVRLLVHWNDNPKETQDAAIALFNALSDVVGVTAGDNYIQWVKLQVTEPIDVGADANDINEYVINFDIYSRRN